MLTLRSILCPIDFSDESQGALRWALALAARTRSHVTVITAVDPLLAEAARSRLGLDLARTETEPALREFVKAAMPAASRWQPDIGFDVRVGDPPEVILEAAERGSVDLIAMGTHGLGGFRKVLLGSTTERVLQRTDTALLAVPAVKSPAVVLDADGSRFDLNRILMATDFSGASSAALRWAEDFARDGRARLVLCHVVARATMPAQWRSVVAPIDDEQMRDARARLETWAARVDPAIPHELVVAVGRPAESIAAAAEQQQARLIVMGLMENTAPGAGRPGAIAYRVLSLAQEPVLVVPSRGGA
jgi:nucleotide-binding universal stress UspA family protein